MNRPATRSRANLAKGRKELQELIHTCDAIEQRKFNPFFLDVKLGVETLREYFPHWRKLEDHCLDAHTINKLSEVVRLQNTQLKFQSSALYADPEFVAKKIERMSEKRLSEVFLQGWHPLAELEQLTPEALTLALEYWNVLLPIQERWKRREYAVGKSPGTTSTETLTDLGIRGEEFSKQLRAMWNSLRAMYDRERKPVDYWRFVGGESYQETVRRAYLASFLITYGYARLHVEGDQMLLTPLDEPTEKASAGAVSFPIPIPKSK